MRNSRAVARAIALFAVLATAVVAGVLLLGGETGDYRLKIRFQNASQLVRGNLVQIAGTPIGDVRDIRLTPDGQAEVEVRIHSRYAPLREGTLATVRQASLSGVANRYIDLRLPPSGNPPLAAGETIEPSDTTSAVDLDELFNTFDPKARRSLQRVIRGSGRQYEGIAEEAREGWRHLNPSLVASSRLFRELNRDEPLLERFVVASSQLVTDIAERRDDLAGLVDSGATTLDAIAREEDDLQDAIARLPDVMRRANTTFVNLRATLDDLDPLVEESKPVARKLRPFLADLRPFAADARPTLRDLSRTIRRAGSDNDLIDLNRRVPALRDITTRPVTENGKRREAAFPAAAKAFKGATPEFAFFRPYTVDLLGWFDDFSHSGIYDALGGASRAAPHVNAFTFSEGLLQPIPAELRPSAFLATAETDQRDRCPGSAEHRADDGSNPWMPAPDFPCDPTQVLPGQ